MAWLAIGVFGLLAITGWLLWVTPLLPRRQAD